MAASVLAAACVVAVLGVVLHNHSVHDMFLFAVALAVSAIPEGLPVALTVALAIGTARMARRGVIVRRLAAVEGLGSCTLIASDKTGTLTCNELTVREIRLPTGERFEVSGEGFVPEGQVTHNGQAIETSSHPALDGLAGVAVLCNEGDLHRRNGEWIWRGDAVDLALLAMAHKLGWTREASLASHPQVNEIPFEPERQFAASYHQADGATDVFVKGAPERVLAMCDWGARVAQSERSQHARRDASTRRVHGPSRVTECWRWPKARRTCPELDPAQAAPEPSNLTFLGFVGMIDPLRPGVRVTPSLRAAKRE